MGYFNELLTAMADTYVPGVAERRRAAMANQEAMIIAQKRADMTDKLFGIPGTINPPQQQQPRQLQQLTQYPPAPLIPEQQVYPQPRTPDMTKWGDFTPYIMQASQSENVPPEEIAKIIGVESNWNPKAQSPTGPRGLMQLTKAAMQDVGYGGQDAYDPQTNIMAGTKYYKKMLDMVGGNTDLAHLAYHDGPSGYKTPSKAGLDYVNKFKNLPDVVKGPALQAASDSASTELTRRLEQDKIHSNPLVQVASTNASGSAYLPNRMQGGSGLLGVDDDPGRRAVLTQLRDMFASGDPVLQQAAMVGLENFQKSTLEDRARTANQKDIMSMGYGQGEGAYNQLMQQQLVRPVGGTNVTVQMPGEAAPQVRLMSNEAKQAAGLPTYQQYYVTKDGEPRPIDVSNFSEGENKAAAYENRLNKSEDDYNKLTKNWNPTSYSQYLSQYLPDIISNFISPDEAKRYSQIQYAWGSAHLRDDSGAVLGVNEMRDALQNYFPRPNDTPELVAQKAAAREAVNRSQTIKAGGRAGAPMGAGAQTAPGLTPDEEAELQALRKRFNK